MWKAILRNRADTTNLMDHDEGYVLTWKGQSTGTTLSVFCGGVIPQGHKAPLARGIWSKKPTKFCVPLEA